MGRIKLSDPERTTPFSYDFTNNQRPPKSPDPYADYLESMSYADAVRKDTTNQQNQNPSNSSRAPNTNTGGASGGRRDPNTNTGGASGGSRASNTDIGSATGGAVSVNTPSLSPSSSSIQLQFGNLKYDPSLLNTSHIKFANTVKTSSPPQVTSSSSSEAGISSSDIHKLQHLIKLAIAAGRLRRKCRKCGNSVQHCCEQTILEAVSSLP